ncbi:hypothetical protein CHLRE_17g747947v5 [Chlamydomonas reinhardtii]|uniref:Uncharacterized protein n=1 Tax=Chlamydomonas reinhardtii TaxID=3055 RepID=A0A2K3CS84_CHLRE|nr:uncharacterized protein CHLRE_17g747947v5 [Chlamydomonas reinhardtii]PNW71130.1 hypothetical protein CHLRE_17g747947v5 [Chlamydomonas reinhardtii]
MLITNHGECQNLLDCDLDKGLWVQQPQEFISSGIDSTPPHPALPFPPPPLSPVLPSSPVVTSGTADADAAAAAALRLRLSAAPPLSQQPLQSPPQPPTPQP